MVSRTALPKGITTPSQGKRHNVTGVTATSTLSDEISLRDVVLLEFSASTRLTWPIPGISMHNTESSYNMILGMAFLQAFSIDICNSSKTVAWKGVSTPFKPPETFDQQTSIDAMLTTLLSAKNDDNLGYKSKSSTSLFRTSTILETLPSNTST
jgi:hypothetical protein